MRLMEDAGFWPALLLLGLAALCHWARWARLGRAGPRVAVRRAAVGLLDVFLGPVALGALLVNLRAESTSNGHVLLGAQLVLSGAMFFVYGSAIVDASEGAPE